MRKTPEEWLTGLVLCFASLLPVSEESDISQVRKEFKVKERSYIHEYFRERKNVKKYFMNELMRGV